MDLYKLAFQTQYANICQIMFQMLSRVPQYSSQIPQRMTQGSGLMQPAG